MHAIMKAIFKIALLSSVCAAIFGCTPKADPVEPETPQVQPESRTLTFVLPETDSEGLKTAWESGDQIVVHGEYSANQVVVTLEAGDISSDGKSATKKVDGLYPYKSDECSSTLYAAYPAEAVANLKHCFYYSAFKNVNAQLLAACNSGDTFQFLNLCGVLSFVVEGDYDSYTFIGRKDVPVSFDTYQVKITDTEKNLKQFLQNPSTSIESTDLVADGVTPNTLFIPGGLDLTGGFILRFNKEGKAVKGITEKEAVAVEVGGVLDLGNVTEHLVEAADDIDPSLAVRIDAAESANCYIISAPGLYKFTAVKGNSMDAVTGGDHAEILWETECGIEPVAERSIVSGVTYDEETGAVCFQIPDPLQPGNALVALMDDNDQVLWSWHLWIPETQPETIMYSYMTGVSMMSRNLGALVDTQSGAVADSRSFGLLYQWGRKDPFPGVGAAGSTEAAAVAGVTTSVHEGAVTHAEAAALPTSIINVGSIDWCTDRDRMDWGDQERSGSKTIYDPCPPGYCVAGRKQATIFTDAGNTLSGWLYDADNAYFQVGSPVSTLPLCGYMNPDGSFVAGASIIWNTHMDADTANLTYCQLVEGGSSKKGQKARAIGGSVRCVTE